MVAAQQSAEAFGLGDLTCGRVVSRVGRDQLVPEPLVRAFGMVRTGDTLPTIAKLVLFSTPGTRFVVAVS